MQIQLFCLSGDLKPTLSASGIMVWALGNKMSGIFLKNIYVYIIFIMRCIVVVPWVNGADQSASVHTVCREWNQNESRVPQPHKRQGINDLIHIESQEQTKIYTVLTCMRLGLEVEQWMKKSDSIYTPVEYVLLMFFCFVLICSQFIRTRQKADPAATYKVILMSW